MRKPTLGIFTAMLITGLMAFTGIAAAQTSGGKVTVVHGIPGLTVDVYVNGALTLEDFQPGDVAGPLDLPAGDYDLAITAADDDIANAVLTPDMFRRFRAPLQTSPLIEVAGKVQNVEGVIHLRVSELSALPLRPPLPPSHDFR